MAKGPIGPFAMSAAIWIGSGFNDLAGFGVDSYLLALAEASAAEFLVTGDKKLQSLGHHKSTRIISPAAMIELLKEADKGRNE